MTSATNFLPVKELHNDKVLYFHSYSEKFNCFPKNLENIFPNLVNLEIENGNISTLERSDLKPFGDKLALFYVHTSGNIDVIPADLFKDTINLEAIQLNGNNIKHVGRGAFDNLEKLEILMFGENFCHSDTGVNRTESLQIITEIYSNCSDEVESATLTQDN